MVVKLLLSCKTTSWKGTGDVTVYLPRSRKSYRSTGSTKPNRNFYKHRYEVTEWENFFQRSGTKVMDRPVSRSYTKIWNLIDKVPMSELFTPWIKFLSTLYCKNFFLAYLYTSEEVTGKSMSEVRSLKRTSNLHRNEIKKTHVLRKTQKDKVMFTQETCDVKMITPLGNHLTWVN